MQDRDARSQTLGNHVLAIHAARPSKLVRRQVMGQSATPPRRCCRGSSAPSWPHVIRVFPPSDCSHPRCPTPVRSRSATRPNAAPPTAVHRGSAASGGCTPSSRPRYRPREEGPSRGRRAMTRPPSPLDDSSTRGLSVDAEPILPLRHRALPAIRAITHVEGKAIGSSRRARRGAGGSLRTTLAPPVGADIEQPDCAAGGVGGPSSSHTARVHGWASRWGRSPLGDAQDDQETSAAAAGLRSLSPAVAVVGTRPDGALACRPMRALAARGGTRSRS